MVVIQERIINSGHGYLAPHLFAVHSTANVGATALNHVNYWAGAGAAYAVHNVSDWREAYHTVPYDALCWQVGNGNATCEGLEICEATNLADFQRGVDIAAQVVAQRLKARGWPIQVVHPHEWFSGTYGGSDHVDPRPYFARWGYTWAQFIDLIQKHMLNQGGNPIMALTQSDANLIAKTVWTYKVRGTQACDRLAGIDAAANGALKLIRAGKLADLYKYIRALYDTWICRTDAAGSGMADNHGKEIKRTPYDRLVWIDKRIREKNPYTTGEPNTLPITGTISEEQMNQIADKVVEKLRSVK